MSGAVQQVPGLTRIDLQEHDLSVLGAWLFRTASSLALRGASLQTQASRRRDHLRPAGIGPVFDRRSGAGDLQRRRRV